MKRIYRRLILNLDSLRRSAGLPMLPARLENGVIPPLHEDTGALEPRAGVPVKCGKHPRYLAFRVPREGCETCRWLYTARKEGYVALYSPREAR
jgi:hypothetical protein